MVASKFEPPVFEIAQFSENVSLTQTPYLYMDNGVPTYLAEPPEGVEPLVVAPENGQLAIGHEHVVSEILSVRQTPPYGVETQMGIVADKVVFEPFWATTGIAAAFGITFVGDGQCVKVESPVQDLAQVEYEYGVWAGHWSPYQDIGNRLLTVVCTDLEHHDFPHVFASTDPVEPLVISVARYWPQLNRIRLADLWVPRGSALYIPPKPAVAGQEWIDLHNNRNSARACWGNIERETIRTHTLLQPENGYFYWFWNALDTAHGKPL